MNQGDVYLVNLDPTVETEIGKTRPGLVISINAMNHNSTRLIVAPITSSTGLDKKRLVKKIGELDTKTLSKACAIAQRLIAA